MNNSSPLLQVNDLHISTESTPLVKGISFSLHKGKTLGIVGESGSGKSLTSLAIMGLLPELLKPTGEILLEGNDLLRLDSSMHRKLRGGDLAMVFQEPMSALNPSMRCGKQVAEVLLKKGVSSAKAKTKTIELFEKVRLPRAEAIFRSYPHQISGGQKQRVVIAMALAANPKLLIADEPTTALDVSVQQSILELLSELQTELNMGMLFISHDLAVVQHVADDILVMNQGEQIEYGSVNQIFESPQKNYTKGLLACRPTSETYEKRLPLVSDFVEGRSTEGTAVSKEVKLASAKAKKEKDPILTITNLNKYFGNRNEVHAVKNVQFNVYPQESLGLVGESGSGKTTIGRMLSGLETPTEGTIFYRNIDLALAGKKQWRNIHEDIQIIFQDPFSSLNPKLKIGEAIAEVLRYRKQMNKAQAKQEAINLLVKTGLTAGSYQKYPHEFSGGQRQRIGIARALAVSPKFIVCDESVSALDVSVQAQVLNLLNDLKDEFGFTYLFISHDLAVVKYFCDRILVLQNGALVEEGFSDELYRYPQNEYTKRLIESVL